MNLTETGMSTSALAPAAQDEIATLFVGFELSKATWLIGLYSPQLGKTISRYKVDGGDVDAALERITVARLRLEKLGKPVRVVSIYEGVRRVLVAPPADGGRHREPCRRCRKHSGGTAFATAQDRPHRSRASDSHAAGVGARRNTHLPGNSGADPGRRGRQTPAPRAGRAGEGENGPHQPHRRDLDGLGHPRRQSTPARFRAAPRRFGDGHRRTTAGPHQTSAGPRARTNNPDRTPDQRHRTRAGKRDQSSRDAAERAGRKRCNRARWCPSCGIGAPERHWTDQRRATVSRSILSSLQQSPRTGQLFWPAAEPLQQWLDAR